MMQPPNPPSAPTPGLDPLVVAAVDDLPDHNRRDEAKPIDNSKSEEPCSAEFENPDRPKGFKFAILFLCIVLGDFFTGYDTSCTSTLTPVISSEFETINQVGWYGTAYLLASCATVLIFGQLYSYFSMKTVLLLSFLVFALGPVVCATASSSPAFIVGRAVSGLGSAGVFAGGSIIVANVTSLKHRPIYQALSGGMESVALALGPTTSGAIAHASNWRVAFYIMIPIGVACCLSIFLFVQNLQRPENADLDNKEKLRRLDLIGFAVYVPAMTCLILGLQWAGSEYSWKNWRIILLLVLSGLLGVGFLALEHRAGEESMFPLHILRQRTVLLSSLYTFCNSAALFVISYYLPIYFQAVRGQSTLGSGLYYIPTAASFAVAILVAGPVTSWIGYYSPVLIFGSVLMAIGTGFITTFDPTTVAGKSIGYQIMRGVGCGLAFQQPYTAVQIVLPESRIPMALVTLSFTQEIGGIVALSISQNVFVNRLAHNVASDVPSYDISDILGKGVLRVIDLAPSKYRTQVLYAYSDALSDVFYIALALSCFAAIISFFLEWRSVRAVK